MINNFRYFFIFLVTLFIGSCTRSAKTTGTTNLIPAVGITQEVKLTPLDVVDGRVQDVKDTPASDRNLTPTVATLTYSVAFLADGEILNVRSGPGVTFDIISNLESNSHKLIPTGVKEIVDEITWVEIQQENRTGWVSGDYLTEEKTAGEVCNDPRVGEILDRFTQAVRDKDGETLSRLVSPVHGLTIHHNLWNPPVIFKSLKDILPIFTSSEEFDWGIQDGSGEPIIGSFNDKIMPLLENVLLQNHTRHCNTLERGVATGPTAGYVYWPYDYSSFNYIAMFRPAPSDQELDWRTWVAGIEYVDGQPYVVVLIQFHWEI